MSISISSPIAAAMSPRIRNAILLNFLVLGCFMGINAMAAGTGGTAIQAAYNAVNDMVNGYGKQLLMVIGFAVAAIGYMAANATSVVMKFIGFAIFLGVALPAGVGLAGATV
jgi:hypothetical protein